jgi:hypothetical protein
MERGTGAWDLAFEPILALPFLIQLILLFYDPRHKDLLYL